jgi:DNA-binding NtrC family response regulator
VLVVDDEPDVLEVASMSLDQLGFRVLTAPDGRAAMDVFRAHAREIDAVLLDLTMPHVSGEEVFEEMRRVRPDVPVVIASGYSEQDVADRLAGNTYAGFIQKPYLVGALATKLRQAMVA